MSVDLVPTTLPALIELRRYRLHPGTRQTLTDVFVDELTHTQEAVGLQVLGPYADEDQPDHFVWLRGFATADPQARGRALAAFYGGPHWAANKEVANATMVAFDDVHLLRPLSGSGVPEGRLTVTTWTLERPLRDRQLDVASDALVLTTAAVANTFPALPVRDEHVLVLVEPAGSAAATTSIDLPISGAPPHIASLTPLT